MEFVWDDHKAALNEAKHGVTFAEAEGVFLDDQAVLFPDDEHSFNELRYIIIGASGRRLLVVVYTEEPDENGGEIIRLISAREVEAYERAMYYEG